MKKVKSKLVAMGLCASMAVGLVAGCGASGSTSTEGETTGSGSTEQKVSSADMPVVNFAMPSFYDFSDAEKVE